MSRKRKTSSHPPRERGRASSATDTKGQESRSGKSWGEYKEAERAALLQSLCEDLGREAGTAAYHRFRRSDRNRSRLRYRNPEVVGVFDESGNFRGKFCGGRRWYTSLEEIEQENRIQARPGIKTCFHCLDYAEVLAYRMAARRVPLSAFSHYEKFAYCRGYLSDLGKFVARHFVDERMEDLRMRLRAAVPHMTGLSALFPYDAIGELAALGGYWQILGPVPEESKYPSAEVLHMWSAAILSHIKESPEAVRECAEAFAWFGGIICHVAGTKQIRIQPMGPYEPFFASLAEGLWTRVNLKWHGELPDWWPSPLPRRSESVLLIDDQKSVLLQSLHSGDDDLRCIVVGHRQEGDGEKT